MSAEAFPPVAGRRVILTQRWESIVWVHWRVDPEQVARRLPDGLEPDLWDGSAWVGLVPFEMTGLRAVVGARRLPRIGSTGSFSEVNVRTYVRGPHGPGVWFDSLDATSRLAVAVARGAWALPYRRAAITRDISDSARAWTVDRGNGVTGHVAATVGPVLTADALDEFLTARFRLYAPLGRAGAARWLVTAPIRHRAWTVREATLHGELDAGLVSAAGYSWAGPPDHVLAADPVEVEVGFPQIVRPQARAGLSARR